MSNKQITEADLRKAVSEYRQAMIIRWIHPSQDKAAHNLAKMYSDYVAQQEKANG